MYVTRTNSEEEQAIIIYYRGKEIKRFSYYDDFAFTKANDFMDKMRGTPPEEFFEIYPEHAL